MSGIALLALLIAFPASAAPLAEDPCAYLEPVDAGACYDRTTAIAAILKDRAQTRQWLKSDPLSYLASVSRRSFGDAGTLTLGSAADNDIVLEDPSLLAHQLRLSVEGDSFRVEALDAAASFTLDKGTAVLREAKTAPARVGLGRFNLRLSHQGYPAVIVFDSKSPRFRTYKDIPYFPIDLSYRYTVRLVPDPKAETLAIQSTNSADRRAQRVGWFEFNLGGAPIRLAAHRLLEPGSSKDSLSVLLRDATTGKESYKVGRYVEPKREADGSYILDFNMAYNPACAYSEYFNCPIPPKENFLPVAIKAGEKDPPYHR